MANIQIADLQANEMTEQISDRHKDYAYFKEIMEAVQRNTPRDKSVNPINIRHTHKVKKLKEAAPFPSFAEYMDRCLYDPVFGYYTSGNVAFGSTNHFFSYPGEMSPVFGWMAAEAILSLLKELIRKQTISSDAPLTVLELGAGEGFLARDVLDYIHNQARISRWKTISKNIQYVIIEKSTSLRKRQEELLKMHILSGHAKIIESDAAFLAWDGEFYGVVIANEFIDALPCERIRIFDSLLNASRIHVVPSVKNGTSDLLPCPISSNLQPLIDKGYMPIDSDSLWEFISCSHCNKKSARNLIKLKIKELEAPLVLGWIDRRGKLGSPPSDLIDFLDTIRPLITDLEASKLLPTELLWSQILPVFVNNLSRLIHGRNRSGVALFIDYGGTSRHVLDPRSFGPHLRVYSDNESSAHQTLLYARPGYQDITWDIDFSELARLANLNGLNTLFFGHQSALERPPIDLLDNRCQNALLETMLHKRTHKQSLARSAALAIVARYREASGFRMMLLAPRELAHLKHPFGPSDPLRIDELDTISHDIDPEIFRKTPIIKDFHRLSEFLKPCGDPVSDLSDLRLYRHRKQIMGLLKKQGYLSPPGALANINKTL